jgi:RNA polymerase sigma-70 factor (ECF subfamily)
VPDRPGAWLLTPARRKGIDHIRRQAKYRERLELVAALAEAPRREADDRLRLIFTCCHHALARDAQVALTLRAVVGPTTSEIARAFVIPEATLAKRIVRAKRKIVPAGIPYGVPGPDDLRSRLDEVLTVLYLVFNEGHLATSGDAAVRHDLARDAEWLAGLVVRLLPDEPEPLGLLALIRLPLARWPARLDARGRLVLLEPGPIAMGSARHYRGDPANRSGGWTGPPGPVPAAGRDRGGPLRGAHLGGHRLAASTRSLHRPGGAGSGRTACDARDL